MNDPPTSAPQAKANPSPPAETWDHLAVVVLAGDRAVTMVEVAEETMQ